MAIGLLFVGEGVTQAQYEQVLNEVNPNRELAPGAISHMAGPSEKGWCVMEVWESQEDLQRFFDDKLGKALQAANINVQPVFFEI